MAEIYTLRVKIEGPELYTYETPQAFDKANEQVVDDLRQSDAISNIEDVINDELPDGYFCRIEE